jgi:hypothetical protein
MVTMVREAPPRRDVPRVSPDRLSTRSSGRRLALRGVLCLVALAIVLANAFLQQRSPDPVPAAGSALEALETLATRAPAPADGYDREAFGPAWADVDHNGCDTRNDILSRDLVQVAYADDRTACVVREGMLDDPYTGTTIEFVRGAEASEDVQVDHVVALLDAWRKGAAAWDAETRLAFANDPLNLLASDGPAKMAKGARDASEWQPPDASYRCEYVARQIAVKVAYELAVSPAEHDAMQRVLATCPAEPLPRW